MFSKTLLSTLLLSIAVAANLVPTLEPYVKLSLSRYLNSTGVFNILKHDQARARHLVARATGKHHLQSAVVGEPVSNDAGAGAYMASVRVGSPATTCTLSDLPTLSVLTSLQITSSLIREGEGTVSDSIAVILTAYTARTPGLVLTSHILKRELVSKPVTMW
jgi:hypothetical protein